MLESYLHHTIQYSTCVCQIKMYVNLSFLITVLLITPLIITESAKPQYILCSPPLHRIECELLNKTLVIQCIEAEDELSCIERVDKGNATFTSISYDAAFFGVGKSNAVILATFQLRGELLPYDYQTAIASNRNISDGLSTLRNTSYCHPGFDTTDINPLLLIDFERKVLSENGIDICSNNTAPLVEKHINAIHDFFGPSCRPGRWVQDTEFDIILKNRYPHLLALCNSTAYQRNSGNALNKTIDCVLSTNNSAVALTTISTLLNLQKEEIPLFTICRNGNISNATSYPCEWSNIPNRIIIANKKSYKNLLVELAHGWFSLSPVDADELSNKIELNKTEVNLLGKVLFPNPPKEYVIKVQTPELQTLHDYTTGFTQNLTIQQSIQCATEIRWCTISDNEQRKCETWSRAVLHHGIQPVLACIQRQSARECINSINKNEADVVRIDADYGYFAKLAGLEAIAFPKTDLVHTLVIVKPTITTMENLRRRKGCFNSYGSAAWLSFLNVTENLTLYNSEFEYGKLLNDALGSSCLPGANSLNLTKLCSLCKSNATEETICATSSIGYAGNQGALDCLRDVGDFAVISKTDNLILPEDVRILCRNGTFAHNLKLDVDKDCYLSTITSDIIVARRNDPKNVDIKLMLREADGRFGGNSKYPFKLFGKFDSIPNLLFKDSTLGLDLPNSDNLSIKNYQNLFQLIDNSKNKNSLKQVSPSLMIIAIISLSATWWIA